MTGRGVVIAVGPVYAARWRMEGMRERLVMLRVIHCECGYRCISGSQEIAGRSSITAAKLCSTGENSHA